MKAPVQLSPSVVTITRLMDANFALDEHYVQLESHEQRDVRLERQWIMHQIEMN